MVAADARAPGGDSRPQSAAIVRLRPETLLRGWQVATARLYRRLPWAQ